MTEPNEQHIPLGDGRDKDQDDTVNTANKKKSNVLKKGMDIKYKINDDGDDWYKAKLLSRSGRASGKYKNEWNVEDEIEGRYVLDFDAVDEWEEYNPPDTQTQETQITEVYQTESLQEIHEAKTRELESWSKHEVYDEVEDIGQDCISVRWVVTPKLIERKHTVKARLCARDFEESAAYRTDSPTYMRESVLITLCIVATQGWTLRSIDFKTAFL